MKVFKVIITVGIMWLFARYVVGVNVPLLKKAAPEQDVLNQRINLSKDFSISVFADNLPGARILLATASGDLLLSSPGSGKIFLLTRDKNKDGLADARIELMNGLYKPHGMAFYKDWLYIAEGNAIGRIRFDAIKRQTSGDYEHVVSNLPRGGNHWSRTVHFGPDAMMYVSIGSSCNSCEEKDLRRATIMRFPPDGGKAEIYATGLRNTVGFDWHPVTGLLYGVDNGMDFLGDDFPPGELNRIEQNGFYGWPYINGNQVSSPEYAEKAKALLSDSIAPAFEFGAHVAPLSIKFIHNPQLRKLLQADALVALHGSWNRSEKSGYKVVALKFGPDEQIVASDFITGFELDDDVIGRPVDIAETADGNIYISDDFSGTIYRIANIQ